MLTVPALLAWPLTITLAWLAELLVLPRRLIVPVLLSPAAVTVVAAASPVLPMLTVPLLLSVWPIARLLPPGSPAKKVDGPTLSTASVPALLKVALATPPGFSEIGVGSLRSENVVPV